MYYFIVIITIAINMVLILKYRNHLFFKHLSIIIVKKFSLNFIVNYHATIRLKMYHCFINF